MLLGQHNDAKAALNSALALFVTDSEKKNSWTVRIWKLNLIMMNTDSAFTLTCAAEVALQTNNANDAIKYLQQAADIYEELDGWAYRTPS